MKWKILKSPLDRWDWLFLAGAGLVFFGAWQIYPPAGYILAGLMLCTVGAFKAK